MKFTGLLVDLSFQAQLELYLWVDYWRAIYSKKFNISWKTAQFNQWKNKKIL